MDVLFGILAPALQLALAVVMVCRRVVAEFRFFFTYTAYSVAVIGVRLWARSASAQSFFLWYSATDIVYGWLALLALVEAFKAALNSYAVRFPWVKHLPLVAVLMLVVIPVWNAVYRPYLHIHSFNARFASATYSFTTCVRCAEIVVFILYLTLKRRYSFRRYNAGIIGGFGVYASVMLCSFLLHYYLGNRFEWLYRYLAPGAYVGAAVIWLLAFIVPDTPSVRQPPNQRKLEQAHTALQQDIERLRNLKP
jgi:hypothetical protein